MDRYPRDEWTVTPSFDAGAFGAVQLAENVIEYKGMREQVWESFSVGGSFTAAPVAANGKIYVGCHDQNFYCLTLEGEEVWRFTANSNFTWEAVVDGDTVYAGNFDGNLYALNANTGELK